MHNRPVLPKRLASKIRAAQQRVESARLSIVHGEDHIREVRAELQEFSRDPRGYAARRYPGHGVDSYPVCTRIERKRSELDYNLRRTPERHAELASAEKALADVETEVLATVQRMKRQTKGRVPWPSPLPPFSHYREEFDAEMRQMRKQAKAEAAVRAAEIEREYQSEMDRHKAEHEAEVEKFRAEFATWSTAEQQAYREAVKKITAALRSGDLTFPEILSAIRRGTLDEIL